MKEGTRKGRGRSAKQPCTVPGCGRPAYARGLCQSHHRQQQAGEELRPIRPYRRRSPETVGFAGLRLTPGCAEELERFANAEGLSRGAAVAEILEQWYAAGARPEHPTPHGSGAPRRDKRTGH